MNGRPLNVVSFFYSGMVLMKG